MTKRDFFLAFISGLMGSVITVLGTLYIDYSSRIDRNSQEQLKFFRDHAIKDTILASKSLDEIYDKCLKYGAGNFETKIISSPKSELVKIISYFNDSLDLIKIDFAYMKINTSDIFSFSEVYMDKLKTVFDFSNKNSKELSDICHDNITQLKKINKRIRMETIKSIENSNLS
jgi:hypothetical protein